jgi:hypothetical protein
MELPPSRIRVFMEHVAPRDPNAAPAAHLRAISHNFENLSTEGLGRIPLVAGKPF